MKANTTKQYSYTGDYYGYTLVTSADGTISNRVYNTTPSPVAMSLSVNLLGELVILTHKICLKSGSRNTRLVQWLVGKLREFCLINTEHSAVKRVRKPN